MSNIFNNNHAKQGGIKLSKSYKRYLLRRRILSILFVLIVVGASFGVVKVLSENPILTPHGYVTGVKEHRYNVGSRVLVVDNNDIFNKLKAVVIEQEVMYGKIVSGPYGKITKQNDGTYKIQDANIVHNVNLAEEPTEGFLNNQYVIEVDGLQNAIIVEHDNIVGTIGQ